MNSVLELNIQSSIISGSNWENLKYVELQPNLPYAYKKRVYGLILISIDDVVANLKVW